MSEFVVLSGGDTPHSTKHKREVHVRNNDTFEWKQGECKSGAYNGIMNVDAMIGSSMVRYTMIRLIVLLNMIIHIVISHALYSMKKLIGYSKID